MSPTDLPLGPQTLVATDFDGTIAPLVDDPEQSRPHPDAVAGLVALARTGARVAIITGRDVRTVLRLSGMDEQPGLENLIILGQYGVERWDAATGEFHLPEDPAEVRRFAEQVPEVLARAGWSDLYVEDKGRAIGVHTRRARDPEGALEAISGPLTALAEEHGLRVEPGHLIIEVRAPGVDKGDALRSLVDELGSRHVLYCGDDLGDLPAFDAVRALQESGVHARSVAVAPDPGHPVTELADLVVASVPEMAALFHRWAAR